MFPAAFLLIILLFLHPSAEAATTRAPVSKTDFQRIAQSAEQARTGDRLPEAIRLYREAVRLHPGWGEGWWYLGSILYEQNRFSEARDAFARFATIAPNPAPAYAFLGLCEYEMHDYGRASEHLRLWIEKGSPGNNQLIDVASYRWALLLTRNGHFFEALYLLTTKVEKHGPDPALAEGMGLAWMRMKYVPEDYPQDKREMVWLAGMAAAYLSAQKLDRVHEFQDRLVAHYGDSPNVHFFRGYIYEFEKRYDEAADEYRKELKVWPDNVGAITQLCLIDAENAQVDEALPLATRAVSIDPKNPLAHYALGRVYLANEKWTESVRELETARQIAPTSARVRFHLAKAYRKLGRTADAVREDAVFEKLKDKEEVFATPEEKLRPVSKGTGGRK